MIADRPQRARGKPEPLDLLGLYDVREPTAKIVVPSEANRLLEAAAERLGLSPHSVEAALRVARTIADLDGSEAIRAVHLSEAIQYRLLDRQ